jgi:mRNA interferase MazF
MRGDVYGLRPAKQARGHEQRGRRFAIIVQSSRFEHLSTWLAIPTSTSARPFIFRPQIEVPAEGASLALCEGLVSIDPAERLGVRLGSLTFAEMQEIDQALLLLMDLEFT